MKRVGQFLRELIKLTFKEKWENIGAIIGGIISIWSGLAPGFVILMGLFCVALALDLAFFLKGAMRDLREKHIPILVIIGQEEDNQASMEEKVCKAMEPYGFDPRDWDIRYNFELRDVTIWRKSKLPLNNKSWIKIAKDFARLIARMDGNPQIKGQKIYHVFIYGPAALAAGLGAVVGTKSLLVLHQYSPATANYVPVIDFSKLKEGETQGPQVLKIPARRPFQYVQEKIERPAKERLFVELHLGSDPHDPQKSVEVLAAREGASVAHIRKNYPDLLEFDQDWARAAREIITILSPWIAEEAQVRRVELFINAPTALMFAVCMALGSMSPVTIHNWFKDEQIYYPVLELNRIE